MIDFVGVGSPVMVPVAPVSVMPVSVAPVSVWASVISIRPAVIGRGPAAVVSRPVIWIWTIIARPIIAPVISIGPIIV